MFCILLEAWINQESRNEFGFNFYIFPDGYTPSFSELMPAIEKSKLVLGDLEVLPGIHYASTLEAWLKRFIKNKDKVLKNYDEKFYRIWLFYLSSCEYAFLDGDQCNFQIPTC